MAALDKAAARRWRRDVFRALSADKQMGWHPGDPTFSGMTVLAAISHVGTDVSVLSELTGFSVAFVTKILKRARKARLVVGQTMRTNWEGEHGWVGVVADSLVAAGYATRVPDNKRSAAASKRAMRRAPSAKRQPRVVLPAGAVFTPKHVKASPRWLHAKWATKKQIHEPVLVEPTAEREGI